MSSTRLDNLPLADTSAKFPWMVGAVAAAAVIGCIAGPRAAAAFVAALAGMAALLNLREHGLRAHAFITTRVTILLLAFCGYVLVNASWSLIPRAAFGKAAILLAIVLVSQFCIYWVIRQEGEILTAVGRGFLIGYGIGALFIAIEIATEQSLARLALNTFEFLRPDSQKHHSITNGEITAIGIYDRNRSVAMLNLLFWPAAAVWSAFAPNGWRWPAYVAATGCLALATFGSAHESSKVALVVGIAVFLLCWLNLLLGRAVVLAAWTVACLLAVPIASGLYEAGLHKAEWLPRTARARVILWGYTAERYWERPILGVGVNSTREIDRRAKPTAEKPADHVYARRTGRHAHNVFVQTWFELGAIGALMLLVIGLAVLRMLARVSEACQPMCFAGFAVAMSIATFSWGMWQTWFQAAFAFTAIGLALTVRVYQVTGSAPASAQSIAF